MIRLNSLHISRLKWHHWLLIAALILITNLTRMNPYWGFFLIPPISIPFIGTVLSHISGIFPFALGDLFIALSIVWVILYPIYEIGLRKKLARRFTFLQPRAVAIQKEKGGFREGDGISALDIRMVLCCLGTELFAAQHLLQNGHEACGSI